MAESYSEAIENVADELETINEYVNNGGGYCPHCSSENIKDDACNHTTIENGSRQGVTCNDCGKSWDEIYILHSIDF